MTTSSSSSSLKALQKAYLRMLQATEKYNRALASADKKTVQEFEPWMIQQFEKELERQGVKVDATTGRPKKFNLPSPPSPQPT